MKNTDIYLKRIKRLALLLISLVVRAFSRVKKGRVIMWSYNGKNYSCNPKALTEYILSINDSTYTIYWAFLPGKIPSDLPSAVTPLIFGSWRYMLIVNTAEFLCTNSRMFLMTTLWIKRKNQKYIMTWHSSMGLKCVERDASIESLGVPYVRAAKHDSKQCDLILSGSRARSEVIKRAFWYDGEILEKGTPRNDILFDVNVTGELKNKVREYYNIPNDTSIILYAPTFRESNSLDFYEINWTEIIELFKSCLGHECYVLIRLHPNLIKHNLDTSKLAFYEFTYDATYYNDMQELLIAADVLITDYSSSMFDAGYIKRPVFLHATDYATYDRNTYFDLKKLPFPFSSSQIEFENNIKSFNMDDYQRKLSFFLENEIGSFETGIARKSVIQWMAKHSMK